MVIPNPGALLWCILPCEVDGTNEMASHGHRHRQTSVFNTNQPLSGLEVPCLRTQPSLSGAKANLALPGQPALIACKSMWSASHMVLCVPLRAFHAIVKARTGSSSASQRQIPPPQTGVRAKFCPGLHSSAVPR